MTRETGWWEKALSGALSCDCGFQAATAPALRMKHFKVTAGWLRSHLTPFWRSLPWILLPHQTYLGFLLLTRKNLLLTRKKGKWNEESFARYFLYDNDDYGYYCCAVSLSWEMANSWSRQLPNDQESHNISWVQTGHSAPAFVSGEITAYIAV